MFLFHAVRSAVVGFVIKSDLFFVLDGKEDETLNWMESTGGSRLIESRLLAS
jgi:hypothetical protein